ncbi:hypothetical protein ElyMa_002028500 [Elysia marginata]|uniref:G-protein coupled receptors family 1 profile domain-containing protein n=1 Tax=Elysia marginata TaxID=1093978 RepID=A0AAV4F6A2_9GAST|nr:hypothetical protein ElyMa_002028500 [Elysia marginata]
MTAPIAEHGGIRAVGQGSRRRGGRAWLLFSLVLFLRSGPWLLRYGRTLVVSLLTDILSPHLSSTALIFLVTFFDQVLGLCLIWGLFSFRFSPPQA